MISRIALCLTILLPTLWVLAAYLSWVPWPQLALVSYPPHAPVAWNNPVVATTILLAAWLAIAVRWTMLDNRPLSRIRLVTAALYGFTFVGIIAGLGSGFWTLDSQSLQVLGADLAVGNNPFTPDADTGLASITQMQGPLPVLVSAILFHWSGLSGNWANGAWLAVIALGVLTAATIALISLKQRHLAPYRAFLFLASPLLLIWGAGTLHPYLLAAPVLIFSLVASARGMGVVCALTLALAGAVHPIFFLAAMPLLMPGPTMWADRPMTPSASFRGGILVLALGAVMYSPLFAAMVQDPFAFQAWRAVPDAAPGFIKVLLGLVPAPVSNTLEGWGLGQPGNGSIFWWVSLICVTLVSAIIGFAGIVAQSVHQRTGGRAHDHDQAIVDHRARACAVVLIIAIGFMSSIPFYVCLLVLPILARVPNLAISFAVIGLAVAASLGQAEYARWLSLLVSLAPIVGLAFGLTVETLASLWTRNASRRLGPSGATQSGQTASNVEHAPSTVSDSQ